MKDKMRIIELQKQLSIARRALERIAHGTFQAEAIAVDALDKMMPLDAKYPLQGLVGHEPRKKSA